MRRKTYEYEVALSFAGQDRAAADALARLLDDEGITVFYDLFEKDSLWGKDLFQHLADIYKSKARYCVVFVSRHYRARKWTKLEFHNAQARLFSESNYILPIKVDGTRLPGLNETVGYLDLKKDGIDEIANTLIRKLGDSEKTLQRAKEALAQYRDRLKATVSMALAPLATGEDGNYGEPLIKQLRQPKNWLLVGATGTAKTFHLDHLTVALAGTDDELVIPLRASHYDGGSFDSFVNRELTPYTAVKGTWLTSATRRCGIRPVLIIDALNECPEQLIQDLLLASQAFVMRYDGRVVLSAQAEVVLPSDLSSERVAMSLPNADMKRVIFAYHAGLTPTGDLDRLCSGFTNAYDLAIAGRCHRTGDPPTARAQLYDRYVREALSSNALSGAAFLRALADALGSELAFSLSQSRFDRLAEDFAQAEAVPLPVLDAIVHSRLLITVADTVAFEHELLLRYFQAEVIQRAATDPVALAESLNRPRNRALRDFVLSRLSGRTEIAALLGAARDIEFLARAAAGEFGELACASMLDECNIALDQAFAVLRRLSARCDVVDTGGARRRIASVALMNVPEPGERAEALYSVIGRTLDNQKLLERVTLLIQATEAALRRVTAEAATDSNSSARLAWGSVLHKEFVLQGGNAALPCSTILHAFSEWSRWGRKDRRDDNARSAIRRLAAQDEPSDIAVLYACESLPPLGKDEIRDITQDLCIVKYAWNTGIYSLRISALHFIQLRGRFVHEGDPDLLQSVRDLLLSFEADNVLESSALVDALSVYGALEGLPSASDAAAEIQAILTDTTFSLEDAEVLSQLGNLTPQQMRGTAAYSAISRMFDEPSSNAYSQAYESLGDEERCTLLALAAFQDDSFGMHIDWILVELIKLNRIAALPVFERFATALPIHKNSFSVQEDVANYFLGLKGYAQWLEEPPVIPILTTALEQVWATIGTIAFWHYRLGESAAERTSSLWEICVENAYVTAGVLFDVAVGNIVIHSSDFKVDFSIAWPSQVREIAEVVLRGHGEIPSLMPHQQPSTREFLVDLLAKIGDDGSLPVLYSLIDDSSLGVVAVAAIAAIQRKAPTARS